MINKLAFVLLLGSLSLLSACKSSKKTASLNQNNQPKPAVSKLFKLSQGACFGKCPVYDITLMSDSTLVLHGKNFMNYIGNYKMKLSASQFTEMKALRTNIKIDTFKNSYNSDIADLSSVTYYFFDDYDVMKKKILTQGVYPPPLYDLSIHVSKYINHLGWEKDVTADSLNLDELIVQMKDGKKVETIIEEHWRYKLFIKETLAKSSGIYLIGFDKGIIGQNQLINLLKTSENVMYVEKNNRVELRNK